ncbi:TonB-dependent hemoglobin/transferrin/lactoferrin family receptor [Neisseria iguanae]|uniref:TonB-dependent hemoglobin/transferrin/lactoferrin family receptor n=1 Tax=Neisseria iguanae TaxID=90242 RepID=UPI003CCBC24A
MLVVLLGAFSVHAVAETETTTASAADAEVELNEIQVKGRRTPVRNLGKERVKRQELDENLVQDIHDMVRYDPGISVVEGGRAGSNGFAVRGVDKDRVAITVDGLTQGESRSSEAFQEIFGAYGNFNTNRNAGELETIKEVVVQKGADSLAAGSGALGGAVMYTTKSPSDYVNGEKPVYVGVKGGYSSRNRQYMGSTTLAGRLGGFDGLFVYTGRHGHETKNHSGSGSVIVNDFTNLGTPKTGQLRMEPDPQNVKSKSTLLKGGYHFNDSNYLSGVYEDYRQDRKTYELSNLLAAAGGDNGDTRLRNDVSYRKRTGLEYENWLENGPWEKLKLNYDKQKIEMTTLTWDYPVELKRRNAEMMFRRRGLYQHSDNYKLTADKQLDFENFSWSMNYGGGYNKLKNSNSNLEYFVYMLYPERRTSNTNENEFLVSSQTKSKHAFWNNTFRFGEQWKLGLGARYDDVEMKTLESDSLNPHVKRQLELKGMWQKKAKFKAPSYAVTLDWSPLKSLTLQSKYSTGFRAPTTDEMWFFFPNDAFYIEPNPDLKEEKARNIELGFNWHGNWGNLQLSGFRTRYKNFIDFVHLANRQSQRYNFNTMSFQDHRGSIAPVYSNINRSSAVVKGLELQGTWQLGNIGLPVGSYATLAATYLKGSADGGVAINAIQPFNGVIGLGYKQPEDRWSLGLNVSYFARKKAKDTTFAYDRTNEPFPFVRHSRNIWLADLIGHYKFGKHVTLRAGVFNLFDRKYYTWDSLRSIRPFGAVNRVDNTTHAGIERFSAPGRNYMLTLEAKF